MANPHRGEFEFTAAGKAYKLHYDNNEFVELEEMLDRGVVGIFLEMQQWQTDPNKIRLKWVRALLWAGLRKHHAGVDIRAAGDLIGEVGGVGEAVRIIGEALGKAFPETKGENPPGAVPSGNGIGINSSSTSSPLDTTALNSGVLRPAN